ncbi:MAG: tRNA guanosine(34) transglycosylase Tgt [Bacteroidales bacterium]|nr:tRNA guanosine(34) transglycosylase Tgt [Bacteroidales bacterium]
MFEIQKKDPSSGARTGIIRTDHGKINTPVFMPVGTAGTVKGVLQRDLKEEVKAGIILCNTYHLYLRPGTGILREAGGLHKFMNWDGALLTDSGGYQVFSLSDNRKLTEEGALFRSHIDGSAHTFTPESVVDIQRIIGADIIMAFDECTPYPCDYDYALRSMALTHGWLDRAVKRFNTTDELYSHRQVLFPIVQGSIYADLRKQSAEYIAEAGMPGNAIGGLSVGEPADLMYEMIEVVNAILPGEKPRYLMGVGTPVNILEAIDRGIDMFDCVIPTRNGRNGMLFTGEGIINIKNSKWANDFTVIDEKGPSDISRSYSKAYLRHLIISGEMLGAQIASLHNLAFYLWLVDEARTNIEKGEYRKWKNRMIVALAQRI